MAVQRSRHPFLKSQDSWIDVLVLDHFTVPLTYLLARTPFTPNAVTIGGIAARIVSAIFFFHGHVAIGAAAFGVGLLADGVDGKLARHTGRSSRVGGQLDYTSDCALAALLTIAIGWNFGVPAWLIGACAAVDAGSAMATVASDKPQHLASPAETWRARHALVAAPGSLETHIALFMVAPLIDRTAVIAVLWLSIGYYTGAWAFKLFQFRAPDGEPVR